MGLGYGQAHAAPGCTASGLSSALAHPVTSHIEPLAAQARPVRTREHRIKHDTRMLDRPQRPVGA